MFVADTENVSVAVGSFTDIASVPNAEKNDGGLHDSERNIKIIYNLFEKKQT